MQLVQFDADDPEGLARGMASLDMHSPLVRAGFRYWNSRRQGRAAPARADLDPLIDIPRLVPNVMLFDVRHEPLDFRWRLVGSKVRQNFWHDYTGQWFSEDPNYSNRESSVWRSLDLVERNQQPVLLRPVYVGPHDDFMYVENILLPLSVARDGWGMQMIFIDFIRKKSP
ncbi:MAG: PAS domain-containing protein [Rhodospirillaceae bacterium]|nr:PAS domain-containing protein [Rhodospirillaceae bacterium]